MTSLEDRLRELTTPLRGQYPRPWMSDSRCPEKSRIFLVGFNQATKFDVTITNDDHNAFMDALFNRNGESIRALYYRARKGKGPSPTRKNFDDLIERFRAKCISDVLETNVICYSAKMGRDLTKEGKRAGREIFRTLLDEIRPRVVITHGEGTRKEFSRFLGCELPKIPQSLSDGIRSAPIKRTRLDGSPYRFEIFLIPSLALPAWNRWKKWSCDHFEMLCRNVSKTLEQPTMKT
jgi:hypothetical protein